MAHIRKAYNDLEEKLEEAKRKHAEELQKAECEHRIQHRNARIFCGILGVVLAILLTVVIIKPEIGKAIQEWIGLNLTHLAKVVFSWIDRSPEFIQNMSAIPRFILSLLLKLLILVLSAVLFVFSLILGFIVRIGMYVALALSVLYCIACVLEKYSPPDEKVRKILWFEVWSAQKEMEILQAGVDGENAALDCLRDLGDDCYVFTNLHIPYDGKQSETDIIVVTPGGITIVEVKNHKGTICGSASDQELRQVKNREKKSDQDDSDENCFYNPIKQVATHAYRLAGYLRSQSLHTHIRTCVFFVNPEADLQIRDINADKCPVYHVNQTRQLLQYLKSGTDGFSHRDQGRSVQLLEQLMK